MLLLNSILRACILLAGHACPLYVFTTISMVSSHAHCYSCATGIIETIFKSKVSQLGKSVNEVSAGTNYSKFVSLAFAHLVSNHLLIVIVP